MSPGSVKWSVLDLIDLPPSQRGILLHLSRQGPSDAETLADPGEHLRSNFFTVGAVFDEGRESLAGEFSVRFMGVEPPTFCR